MAASKITYTKTYSRSLSTELKWHKFLDVVDGTTKKMIKINTSKGHNFLVALLWTGKD